MFEYGGLYDESLDDEELVREYKRQRSSKKSPSSDDKTASAGAASPHAEEVFEEVEKETPPSPLAKEGEDGNGSPEASSDSDSE